MINTAFLIDRKNNNQSDKTNNNTLSITIVHYDPSYPSHSFIYIISTFKMKRTDEQTIQSNNDNHQYKYHKPPDHPSTVHHLSTRGVNHSKKCVRDFLTFCDFFATFLIFL